MTVHGAKGLEAPIVILPDTTTRATRAGRPAARDRGRRLPLGAAQGATTARPRPTARALRETAAEHESAAPALCRPDPGARPADRLRARGGEARACGRLLATAAGTTAFARPEIAGSTTAGDRARRRRADPLRRRPGARRDQRRAPGASRRWPPAWAAALAPAEPPVVRYASPSTLVDAEAGPAPSPLAEQRRSRPLPARRSSSTGCCSCCPTCRRPSAPAPRRRLLAREPDLTDDQRAEMAAAALARAGRRALRRRVRPRLAGRGGDRRRRRACPGPASPAGSTGCWSSGPRAGGRLQDQPPGARRASRTPIRPI